MHDFGRGRRTRRLGAVLALGAFAGGMLVTTAGSASAAPPGGTFHFASPARIVDTRSGPKLAAGSSTPVPAGHYVNVTVVQPAGAGIVGLGPCGGAATTTVLGFNADEAKVNRALVGAGECLIPSVETHLIVDDGAYEAAVDDSGYRYFADPDEPFVFDSFELDEPLGTGDVQASLASFVPADAKGVAVRVTLYPVYGDPASATTHACGAPVPGVGDASLAFDPNAYYDDYRENVAFTLLGPRLSLCAFVDAPDGVDMTMQLLGYFTDTQPSGGKPAPTLVYEHETYPGFTSITPTRVLDTRIGLGSPMDDTVMLDLSNYVDFSTEAVVLNVTATEAPQAGYVTAYSCDDQARPDSSNLNYAAGEAVANLVTAPVSFEGFVCLFSYGGGHLVADLAGTYNWGGGDLFSAVAPNRILDTRAGLGAPAGRLGAGQVLDLTVAGRGGVPSGASAVTFSLTATETGGAGFLTAYPCDQPRPTASNVNYLAGQNVPNQVTVKLAGNGHVCLFSHADSHVLVDVAGYYGPGGGTGFFSVTPQRMFDTRGTPPLSPDEELVISLGEVESSVNAAVINLTATEPSGAGFLTAYPCGQSPPNSSNVNYTAGQNVATLATVKLDSFGEFCVSSYADTHVIVDVFGLFTTDQIWYPVFRGLE